MTLRSGAARAILLATAAAFAAALPLAAQAHVVAAPGEARAASYSVIAFRVGHGCKGGSSTVALRVEVPAALGSARPQPKPGWTVDIERAPGPDGKVTAITWKGLLPDEQFDDFAILMKLPDAAGPLYFPATQTCQSGEAAWTQIPAEPAMTGLERPAPSVMVTPAAAAPEHSHH